MEHFKPGDEVDAGVAYGKGYVVAVDPNAPDELDVFVELNTPTAFGSKFWFAARELQRPLRLEARDARA